MAKTAGSTKKNKRPERDMSFEDIESAINEHVTAATSQMKSRSKKTAESEPEEKTAKTEEKPMEAPKGESISVTVKKKAEEKASKPEPKPAAGEAVSVAVRRVAPVPVPDPGAESKEVTGQASETARLKARVGKVIEPPSHTGDEKVDNGQAEAGSIEEDSADSVIVQKQPSPMSAAKLEPPLQQASATDMKPKPEPEPTVTPTLGKPDPVKANTGSKSEEGEAGLTPPKKDVLQAPTVFDTKQYHLPIKPSHHHRKQSVPTGVSILVFLVLFVIGGYIAIKVGFVDIGLELPF